MGPMGFPWEFDSNNYSRSHAHHYFLCGWLVGMEFPAGQFVESGYWREQFYRFHDDALYKSSFYLLTYRNVDIALSSNQAKKLRVPHLSTAHPSKANGSRWVFIRP